MPSLSTSLVDRDEYPWENRAAQLCLQPRIRACFRGERASGWKDWDELATWKPAAPVTKRPRLVSSRKKLAAGLGKPPEEIVKWIL